jgi:hypothetical protein
MWSRLLRNSSDVGVKKPPLCDDVVEETFELTYLLYYYCPNRISGSDLSRDNRPKRTEALLRPLQLASISFFLSRFPLAVPKRPNQADDWRSSFCSYRRTSRLLFFGFSKPALCTPLSTTLLTSSSTASFMKGQDSGLSILHCPSKFLDCLCIQWSTFPIFIPFSPISHIPSPKHRTWHRRQNICPFRSCLAVMFCLVDFMTGVRCQRRGYWKQEDVCSYRDASPRVSVTWCSYPDLALNFRTGNSCQSKASLQFDISWSASC